MKIKPTIMIHLPKISLFIIFLLIFSLEGCNSHSAESSRPIELPAEFECIPTAHEPQTARVISVIDGDTIKIEINNQKINLRYIGINAPELDSNEREIAEQALQFNAQMVENQTVTLYTDISETDRFGRLLRYVFVDDIFVNYELIRMGYARQRDYPPDSACKDLFVTAQAEAISMHRGIWKTE
ncbi:MAG: thermonuclease family protein [Bellilinea sp.]|nr:thermonuclease family protein [Bellilinea sp.]